MSQVADDGVINLHALYLFSVTKCLFCLVIVLFSFFAFEQTYWVPTVCKVWAGHLILITAKWRVSVLQMKEQ